MGAPSALLVQSPSYINVPAGAVLKVRLLLNGSVQGGGVVGLAADLNLQSLVIVPGRERAEWRG